jgi:hypothetical protein
MKLTRTRIEGMDFVSLERLVGELGCHAAHASKEGCHLDAAWARRWKKVAEAEREKRLAASRERKAAIDAAKKAKPPEWRMPEKCPGFEGVKFVPRKGRKP